MRFIVITQRLIENQEYYEMREVLSLDWGKFFATQEIFQGFLPLPLSYGIDFTKYADKLCAVILSGGNDLSCYNDTMPSMMRDRYEIGIIEYCIQNRLPLLGICRGAQIIAHFFNSTIESCIGHVGQHAIYQGDETFIANSFHNYMITQIPSNLIVLATAKDTSIESFKHKTLQIYAIMWHIERENGLHNTQILQEWRAHIPNII